jgi:hypothetical protein
VYGTFGDWSQCIVSCGGGYQSRVRTLTQQTFGGVACPHGQELRSCNTVQCPVDCVPSTWTAWSTCTNSCGGGGQSRTRTVVAYEFFGGAECTLEETRVCNQHQCAIHCATSAFDAWSTCTKSCGTGAQSRSRSITMHAAHGGYVCPYLEETRSCNAAACATDCVTDTFGS